MDADTVAGVLLEPLQGEGGVMVPSSDYLGAVRALCTERNALLMLDEVQTGLGRTGHWFAFQAQGLEPDVVTMAKALGNGMPVGACWARAEVAAAFGPGRPRLDLRRAAAGHGRGPGHAGRDGGRGRVRAGPAGRGPPAAGLAGLPGVVSVRGAGLLLAAQLDDAHGQGDRGGGARGAGCWSTRCAPMPIRVAPPLLVSDDEIDAALAILAGSWAGRPPRRLRPRPDRSADTMPDLFDVDDLWPDDYERVLDLATSDERRPGARRATAWPCCSRSRRPAPATPPRWRCSASVGTRSTSRGPRSASIRVSRPRTSPAPSAATTGSCAPASSTTTC